MKIFRLFLASFLLLITTHTFAGVHAYAEFKDTLSDNTVGILKKYGMPVSYDREVPWFYISGIPGNYTLKFHRAHEIPQQAVLDIIKMCMDAYKQRGEKEEFHIVMYTESQLEWRNSLFLGIAPLTKMKPFFELRIGEKK